MTKKHIIQIFQDKKVRTVWDDEQQKWYFSLVDVCGVLTDQPDYDRAKNYWKVTKSRLIKEGNESVTKCNQLKLVSPKRLESQLGHSVISPEKASDYLPPADRCPALPEDSDED